MKFRRATDIAIKLARVTLARLPDGQQKQEGEQALEILREFANAFSLEKKK